MSPKPSYDPPDSMSFNFRFARQNEAAGAADAAAWVVSAS